MSMQMPLAIFSTINLRKRSALNASNAQAGQRVSMNDGSA